MRTVASAHGLIIGPMSPRIYCMSVYPESKRTWPGGPQCSCCSSHLQTEPCVRSKSLEELGQTEKQTRMWASVLFSSLALSLFCSDPLRRTRFNLCSLPHSQSGGDQRGNHSVWLCWAELCAVSLHQRSETTKRRDLQPRQHLLPLSRDTAGTPTKINTNTHFNHWWQNKVCSPFLCCLLLLSICSWRDASRTSSMMNCTISLPLRSAGCCSSGSPNYSPVVRSVKESQNTQSFYKNYTLFTDFLQLPLEFISILRIPFKSSWVLY